MSINRNALFGLLLMAVALFFVIGARDYDEIARQVPLLVGIPVAILSALQVLIQIFPKAFAWLERTDQSQVIQVDEQLLAQAEAAAAIAGESRDLTVPAEDGYALAATLLEPGRALPDAPLVVIGCAVGVPRRYYAKFAGHIAARGHPVLTFDYRGIGGSRQGSLVGSKVRMRDWCILDVPGVLAWT